MTITINDLDNQQVIQSATISNGAAESAAIDLKGFNLRGFVFPAAWTAANLSLKGSVDNVTFFPVGIPGGTISTLGTAGNVSQYVLGPNGAANYSVMGLPRYIKLWSQTAGVDVNQGADRVFSLVLQPDINRKP